MSFVFVNKSIRLPDDGAKIIGLECYGGKFAVEAQKTGEGDSV